ncbi:hypothetical protein [Alicyclobacillus sp. SO9]|nr:hypothetical protein [Alicyclobacillus sp. SO9]
MDQRMTAEVNRYTLSTLAFYIPFIYFVSVTVYCRQIVIVVEDK